MLEWLPRLRMKINLGKPTTFTEHKPDTIDWLSLTSLPTDQRSKFPGCQNTTVVACFLRAWRGHFTTDISRHNSNLMHISFCCNSLPGQQIATNFSTCHDSSAVVACAKFCSNHFTSICMRANCDFLLIWIVMENSLVNLQRGIVFTFPLSDCQTGLML